MTIVKVSFCLGSFPFIRYMRTRKKIAGKGIRNAKLAIFYLARNEVAPIETDKIKGAIYKGTINKFTCIKLGSLKVAIDKSNIFKAKIFKFTSTKCL